MAVTPYLSQQPVDDFSLRFSNLLYSASLAASTDTSLTIPGDAPSYKAVIKVGTNGIVWVAINGVAAVPAGASFGASKSELITDAKSICREVKGGDVLHFITTVASTPVSVALYSLLTNN